MVKSIVQACSLPIEHCAQPGPTSACTATVCDVPLLLCIQGEASEFEVCWQQYSVCDG